jgi:hypothetical protein
MSRRVLFILTLVVLIALACLRGGEKCGVCHREVHAGSRAVVVASGKGIVTCCPRCALHHLQESGGKPDSLRLTDHEGGGDLEWKRAWLLEGSDETPCLHQPPVMDETHTPTHLCYDRCLPSLLAFAGEEPARAFRAEHGGTLFPPGTFRLPAPPPS